MKQILFRLSIICTIFLLTSPSFSQTKQETQEWIKYYIETYNYIDQRYDYPYMTNVVEFTDCNLVITEKIFNWKIYKGLVIMNTVEIPIKEISKINFREFEEKNLWLDIGTRGNSILQTTTVEGTRTAENASAYDEAAYSGYRGRWSVILKKSIKEDDLDKRMIKAFKHLISLCGGTVITDVF